MMGEAESNTGAKRRKISLLAIASVLIPVIGLIIGSLAVFCLKCRCCGILEIMLGIMLLPMTFLVLTGPVLGFLAFIHTLLSRKSYKGYLLAALGIAMFLPAVRWGPGRAMLWVREEASIQLCQHDMMKLGEAVRAYGKEHNGQYPEANQWCDLLLEYVDSNHIVISILRTYGEKKNYYALNPNASPNSPSDVVLIFETLSDWNQFGGPSLLIDEHHRGFGCNILFNDGHVEFIPPRKFDKLNWGDEQENK